MPKQHNGTTYLSVTEFAELMDVHRNTIFYWIDKQLVKAVRFGAAPKSPLYIPMEEVKRITDNIPAEI